MDNIINPAGQVRSVSHRGSRWARLWVSVLAAGVAAGAVRAQTSYSISTLAGAAAGLNAPAAVVADGAGNLYVADRGNHVIRKVVVSTGVVTTIAGLAVTPEKTDGAGAAARFNSPYGLALDVAGNKLYVSDTSNHTIRVIDLAPATPVVSTFAGSAGAAGSTNGDRLTAAKFNLPYGLALTGGSLYVADLGNQGIRRIVIATGAVSTLAGPDGSVGNPVGLQSFVDSSTPASARFSNPTSLATDGTSLFVADRDNHRIRRVVLATGVVSTLAGPFDTPVTPSGATDGIGTLARFRQPEGIAIDSAGTTLFVAEALSHTLRRIVISTQDVTTMAGSAGVSGTADGLATAARFNRPLAIASDLSANLFVVDEGNNAIRRGSIATVPAITSANNATFALGGLGSFTFTATGSPTPTYSVSVGTLPPGLSLSSAGVLSGVPSTAVGSPFSFTVQASNGVAPAATQVFTLTVNQPPVFTSAASTTFVVGNAATYQVVATGSPAPTFSITAGSLPPTVASLSSAGLITAAPPSTRAGY